MIEVSLFFDGSFLLFAIEVFTAVAIPCARSPIARESREKTKEGNQGRKEGMERRKGKEEEKEG